MIVIGVAGGVASGKSLVTEQLAQLGAVTIDADLLGHEVLREPAVIQALRERWGDRVLTLAGQINRRAVAEIVFRPPPDGPRELEFLESITHPRIGQRLQARLDELAQMGEKVTVLDAALMFKAGWDRLCDRIVFVETPRETRLGRARLRGWTDSEFEFREASQLNLEHKRQRSDWVIDNSRSRDDTFQQVRAFWRSLD